MTAQELEQIKKTPVLLAERAKMNPGRVTGQEYRPQKASKYIRLIVDSDHAEEPLQRRSTTGAFMLGNHCDGLLGNAQRLCHQEQASTTS
eukprot:5221967-Amphidinium_carterae.1